MLEQTAAQGPAAAPEEGQRAKALLQREVAKIRRAMDEVGRVVLGQQRPIEELFISMMCGGHALLEGVPGLGKTLLVRTVAQVCGLRFSRIQFTPDLMPADITGTLVFIQGDRGDGRFEFRPGPIFAQLVLADEINRATPKTQSALLEAMQEGTVTVAGEVHGLPQPFFVLATQNPIEMEGTYPLPEAQVDRFFFRIRIPYPSADVLDAIVAETTGPVPPPPAAVLTPEDLQRMHELTRHVPVAGHVRQAAVRLVLATQPDQSQAPDIVRKYVRYGVSPRGAQALVLAAKARALLSGRYNVSVDDLAAVVFPALGHRLHLNFQAEVDGIAPEDVLRSVAEMVLGRSRT